MRVLDYNRLAMRENTPKGVDVDLVSLCRPETYVMIVMVAMLARGVPRARWVIVMTAMLVLELLVSVGKGLSVM